MNIQRTTFFIMTACALISCATVGRSHTVDFGTVLDAALAKSVDQILPRHGVILVRREEATNSLYYESLWIERPANPDEQAAGYADVRYRLVLSARRVANDPDFRARLVIEAQAQTDEVSAWQPIPTPLAVADYYQSLITDLKVELIGSSIRR